ncbi:hypothetical protein ASO20_00200 [Mycoplasma sp. (ex Biomphalaria glabrata)]|uniref:heat-inducible transcriptional repressor HrcA n=1 Tax=Mycoplasma sp. (ex Biomphalaria glabrata) TaxID=1749074 RepID=UPI00073A774D|nr:heat-inducible transcriptional repressor HrcA [Mycoplasma sp. (ex Biomphalaria glabrata)]ALV23102.1 hypothetical protein ASO20_00200 [Mycoplasma sp. (ex Biomphalaria glabrata)]
MINERQQQILKNIIEEYLHTANPISSNELLTKYELDCSSATIRNDMVMLEEKGLIEKHHFASGRIPTTQGYRYYFENLMENKEASEIQKKLEILFEERVLSIDEVIKESCKIISELTSVAAIVSQKTNNHKLKKIEIIPLTSHTALALLITTNGSVQDKVFNIPKKIDIDDLKKCVDYLNERLNEINLEKLSINIDMIGKIVSKNVQDYERLLQNIIKQLIIGDTTSRSVVGVNKFLSNPEFNDPEKIKKILQLFEENSIWDHLDHKTGKTNIINSSQTHEPQVIFGEDVGTNYRDLAIVSTSYDHINASGSKQISLVGPKRMDYMKINSLLKWLAIRLEEYNVDKK